MLIKNLMMMMIQIIKLDKSTKKRVKTNCLQGVIVNKVIYILYVKSMAAAGRSENLNC